jgi:hypothetical protein
MRGPFDLWAGSRGVRQSGTFGRFPDFACMAASRKPPWDKKNPKASAGKASKKLSPAKKASAKRAAAKAGRPYPNLVDNMKAAKAKKARKKK